MPAPVILVLALLVEAQSRASSTVPAAAVELWAAEAQRALENGDACEASFYANEAVGQSESEELVLLAFNAAYKAHRDLTAISLVGRLTPGQLANPQTAKRVEYLRAVKQEGKLKDARCVPHRPKCGNFIVEGAETCDDGNFDVGDGCSETCHREEVPDGASDRSRPVHPGSPMPSPAQAPSEARLLAEERPPPAAVSSIAAAPPSNVDAPTVPTTSESLQRKTSPTRASARAAARAASARSARLTLETVPSTIVTLDDQLLGQTPLVSVLVPAGTLELTLENPVHGLKGKYVVDTKAGVDRKVRVDLTSNPDYRAARRTKLLEAREEEAALLRWLAAGDTAAGKKLESVQRVIAALESELKASSPTRANATPATSDDRPGALFWTGAVAAPLGLLAGAGGGVLAHSSNEVMKERTSMNKGAAEVLRTVGWGVAVGGGALAVAGGILIASQ